MGMHSTGLMPLGVALLDAAVQWLLEAIFWHARSALSALPLYAVLDAGFDVFTPEGCVIPAGLQVRRAHRRPPEAIEAPPPGSPEERIKGAVEMLLRHYGVTSSDSLRRFELQQDGGPLDVHYGGRKLKLDEEEQAFLRVLARTPPGWSGRAFFEAVNVQLAREAELSPSRAQLVDFGQYNLRSQFDLPIVNLVRGHPASWGGVIHPGDRHYVQPHPALAVPFEEWQCVSAFDLADECRQGRAGVDQVQRRIEELIARTLSKWRTAAAASADRAPAAS